MLPNWKSRRGVTLAEIMVALAVVAIMIVMVVSFTLLISERTGASADQLSVQQERTMLKSNVETWLSAVTAKNATLSLKAADPATLVTDSAVPGLTITRSGSKVVTDGGLTLSFSYGTLKGKLPDGKTITAHTETVESVHFYLAEKADGVGAEYLLYCAITDELGTYTFCVNPHVGEGGAF
jgi:prepilin-type N-terminal cleavage/methylation domain-containing protein